MSCVTRLYRKNGRFITFVLIVFVIGLFTTNWKGPVVDDQFFINDNQAVVHQNVIDNVVKQDTEKEADVVPVIEKAEELVDENPVQRGEIDDIARVVTTPENARKIVKNIPKPTISPQILELHERLNLTNPGNMGDAVILPDNLDFDIQKMINESYEKYRINEFIANLVPLDRFLPDIRTDYCKRQIYSKNLPIASIIMVLHNEPLSMILRTVYSILNRSPEHLIGEIILIDDCSTYGKF